MSQVDTAHAWWSRLRHQGLLLSPVVMLERYPSAPEPAPWAATKRLAENNLSVCGYFSAVFSSQHLSLSGQYFGAGLCGHIV